MLRLRLLVAVIVVAIAVVFAPAAYARRGHADAAATCRSYQDWNLIDNAHIGAARIVHFEQAITAQSAQVGRYWHSPCVRWSDAGWYLYLEPNVSGVGAHWAPGDLFQDPIFPQAICNRRPDASQACAQVGVNQSWTVNASHEVMEALVDPSDQGTEICDPVEQWSYKLDGVWVSDWVKPDGKSF